MIYRRWLPTSTKHAAIPSPSQVTRAKLLKFYIFLSTLIVSQELYFRHLVMGRWSIGLKCDQSVLVWGRKWLVSFLVEIFATFVTIPGRDILWFVLPGSGFSVHESSQLTILTSDALLTKTRNVTYYLLPTSILIIAASFSHCTNYLDSERARENWMYW